jgi:hypothetical protein
LALGLLARRGGLSLPLTLVARIAAVARLTAGLLLFGVQPVVVGQHQLGGLVALGGVRMGSAHPVLKVAVAHVLAGLIDPPLAVGLVLLGPRLLSRGTALRVIAGLARRAAVRVVLGAHRLLLGHRFLRWFVVG